MKSLVVSLLVSHVEEQNKWWISANPSILLTSTETIKTWGFSEGSHGEVLRQAYDSSGTDY